MGFRFRRRVKLAPGVFLNVSKSGLGISAGPPGLKVGVGPRGLHYSAGLPGTGLHYRKDISRSSRRTASAAGGVQLPAVVKLSIEPDGTVRLLDEMSSPLDERTAAAVKKVHGEALRAQLAAFVLATSTPEAAIHGVHLSTPAPRPPLSYTALPYDRPAPLPSAPIQCGLLANLWAPRRRRIETANKSRERDYRQALTIWQKSRDMHDAREIAEAREITDAQQGDLASIERLLEQRLLGIAWPRETLVSFDVSADRATVSLDVDLPEIEELPYETVSLAARGLKLNVKRKSDTQIRKEYMNHVHGVLFRIVGEVFYVLPGVLEVVVSGFTTRLDAGSGNPRDDYLISARSRRAIWETINFGNLAALDLVETFGLFELRRKVTKTGVFAPIEPYA